MKIIELNFYLGGGGASRLMADLSNQFADNNDVMAISVVKSETAENDFISFVGDLSPKVHYVALNKQSGLGLSSLWTVYRTIKNEKPDVVHLHANIILLLIPAILCKNVRYIHTIHTLVTRQYSGGFIKRVANWLYQSRKIIPVTISKECHNSYMECFGRQDDVLIINGRDALKTTKNLQSVKSELDNLGVNENIPVFIHVSRHHPVKNHDRMFKSFQRLTNEGIDYRLIVIGDHYDDYEQRYRNHQQIHLIGARTNIGDYMSFADFYVISSDKEGLPLSLLEAMSMGVIPICTPAGGIKDVLRNGENGYIGEEISDEEFYNTIKQALAQSNNISRENIINEYKAKYSVGVCAEKYMKLYRQRNVNN